MNIPMITTKNNIDIYYNVKKESITMEINYLGMNHTRFLLKDRILEIFISTISKISSGTFRYSVKTISLPPTYNRENIAVIVNEVSVWSIYIMSRKVLTDEEYELIYTLEVDRDTFKPLLIKYNTMEDREDGIYTGRN